MGVVVMGVGFCGSYRTSTGMSYREMIARAATMAYQDAGIEAEELDGAVTAEEDFVSGYSIADEYTPDQLGVVRKPVYTICGDFLHALGSAAMQIRTGRFRRVVVESYCKASNILQKDELLSFAYDPVWNRYGVSPHFLAGIEMQQFIARSPYTVGDVANVVVQNRKRALGNPLAPWANRISHGEVVDGRPVASPLTDQMIARHADSCIVVVLGSDDGVEPARAPVFLTGTGWGSGNSIIERRPAGVSVGSIMAARMACAEAGIDSVADEIDVAYVSDIYAHRQLMHMEALGLSEDALPMVNPDGGATAMGDNLEATSGARFFDAVQQLRGEAGSHQIDGATRALIHGWRGVPTDSCAVAILDAERRFA